MRACTPLLLGLAYQASAFELPFRDESPPEQLAIIVPPGSEGLPGREKHSFVHIRVSKSAFSEYENNERGRHSDMSTIMASTSIRTFIESQMSFLLKSHPMI